MFTKYLRSLHWGLMALTIVAPSVTAWATSVNSELSSARTETSIQPTHGSPLALKDSRRLDVIEASTGSAATANPALDAQPQAELKAVPDTEMVSKTPSAEETNPNSQAEPEVAPEPIVPTLKVAINLTRQVMTVSSEGNVLHTWKISSGRRGYETPTGTYKPTWMARRWYSRQYRGAPMPYSVFFNGGIATHGTGAVGRLGRPASHGCIRLRTKHARLFYNLVKSHGKDKTQIVVKGYAKQRSYRKRIVRRNKRNTVRYTRRNSRKPIYQRAHFRNAFASSR